MATDLGDALTAYCRTGAWWGPLGFADWLVKTGQLAEARYILQVLAETEISPKGLIRLRRVERKLAQELTASARPTADLAGGQANGFAPP
jgi:hypothetical protein